MNRFNKFSFNFVLFTEEENGLESGSLKTKQASEEIQLLPLATNQLRGNFSSLLMETV